MNEKEELNKYSSLPGTTRLAEHQLRKQKTIMDAERREKSVVSNKSKYSRTSSQAPDKGGISNS